MSYRPRTLVLTVALAVAAATALSVPSAPAADEAEAALKHPGVPDKVRFNRDIRPIFSRTCFECHGPDANTREAELRMDVRADAIARRDEIRAIVPGDPDESEAWLLITATNPKDQMPPSDFHTQLSARDKALIAKWIEQGAEYEKHWAFIPPKRPAEPKVKLALAARNAVDAFVLARLEAEGLKPSPGADRRTLIRRVTLDLTGLPPTPDDVEAFVADTSADAYEKVVDRLLSSDAYAEHMARHWLDAARYADTSGYQYDRIRNQWVWRDWVIHAFATNMPFDEFTIQQNAGDLMPGATDATRLATGYHRNHPITIEGGVIDEEYRTEYVMDRVVTTTTTWMGLTFLCARCHDHKYDPVSMDDFYSFYAFFNNVPERGLNGFNPQAKIASPLAGGSQDLEAKIAAAQKRFDAAVAKAGGSFGAWEKRLAAQADAAMKVVTPTAMTAGGGTKLTRLDDGSVLASGANPATQTYQIDFTVTGAPVSAIRLEALTDDSLVNKSTGRATNGNFVLGEFEVHVTNAPGKQFGKIKVVAAEANYQQKSYPVSAAIDDKHGNTGWAIDGNTRFAASEAVFTLDRSVPIGSRIRVRLVHTFGASHSIGRFRLSIPVDGHAPVPADIRKTLATTPGKRSAAQQAALASNLVERYGDAEAKAATTELAKLRAQRDAKKVATPATMILTEMPKPRQVYVLERGEYDKAIKERPVTANVPEVFGGLPEGLPRNRLGLAKWLVSKDNPLTARVTVNRFWAQLFGTGIVKTVEDFGSQGEYPTHPDLLDWLAVEFVESGWDVRHILKTMVTSATYRQSSRITPDSFARDPQNRLLARGPRFRVDAETVRDSALAVAGLLDTTVGGPSVYPYHPQGLWLEINNRPGYSRAYPHQTNTAHLYRRSVYTFWKRTVPPPSMATFDAPEREFCVVYRSRTNTPLQAFVMLHDPQFVEAARKLAERMIRDGGGDADARLRRGFVICTAREPTDREMAILRESLAEQTARYNSDGAAATKLLSIGQSPRDETIPATELAAYASVAQMLLNLSEFITKG